VTLRWLSAESRFLTGLKAGSRGGTWVKLLAVMQIFMRNCNPRPDGWGWPDRDFATRVPARGLWIESPMRQREAAVSSRHRRRYELAPRLRTWLCGTCEKQILHRVETGILVGRSCCGDCRCIAGLLTPGVVAMARCTPRRRRRVGLRRARGRSSRVDCGGRKVRPRRGRSRPDHSSRRLPNAGP